jgi:predicted aspartyl protease
MARRGAFLLAWMPASALIWGAAGLLAAQASVVADLPYRIGADRRVITQVTIDGKGPFDFLVDTAASRSMMFEHLRARLGLAASDRNLLTVYGMNNVGAAVPVKPRELKLADETLTGLTMGVLPDDTDISDGVLGMDALSRYLVILDRKALRMRLLEPDSQADLPYRDWPSAELSARPLKDGAVKFWTMRTSIGGTKITTLLDMGSGVTMLNWAAAKKLGYKRTAFPADGVPKKLRDALGTIEPVGVVTGQTIWAGGRLFADQTIIIANAGVFRYFGLEDSPAAIAGPGLLGDHSLAIDFSGHRLYIGPDVNK